MKALYKLSKIIQMKLIIILSSKWVGILILSWSQRASGFQGTFSEFPAFGDVAAVSAFLWGGRLLSGISSPKGSGRAHGWSWQTHTSSQENAAPFSALHTSVWCSDLFWPQIKTSLQMLGCKAHHGSQVLPPRKMQQEPSIVASMRTRACIYFILPYRCTSFAVRCGWC